MTPLALERLRRLLPALLQERMRSARELARELRERASEALLPTAFPALDRLLGGGLPRGELVEIVGTRSSGRFSTLLATLATITDMGEAAALVDLGDGLDPQLGTAMGIDLQRLLWLRPQTLKQALAGAEILIGGGFPLVVLDLGNPPVRGGRGGEAVWLRLARAARTHRSALLVGSPYRVSGTAAAAVIEAGRARATWHGYAGCADYTDCTDYADCKYRGDGGEDPPRLLAGARPRIAVEKRRGRQPGGALELALRVAEGRRLPELPRLPRPRIDLPLLLPADDAFADDGIQVQRSERDGAREGGSTRLISAAG